MAILKDKIEMNNGFFKGLYNADSEKYVELFGAYNEAFDSYFYNLFGHRTASTLTLSNTLDNVGAILWIRYYNKWKSYSIQLNSVGTSVPDATNKRTYKETYSGKGTNGTNNNELNKSYGFDSPEGKPNTETTETNDSNSTNDYTKDIEESVTDSTNETSTKKAVLSLLDDYDFFMLIVKDILKLTTEPLYNTYEKKFSK